MLQEILACWLSMMARPTLILDARSLASTVDAAANRVARVGRNFILVGV